MTNQRNDIAAIISKGVLGAIPFVGPMASEIVGAIIPNQRIDRIEKMLLMLETKLSKLDKSEIESKIKSPEYVDIVEDCLIQTSRALTDERKDYIASLLKNSITSVEFNHLEYKKLLYILYQLNDIEIVILKSYSLNDDTVAHYEFKGHHKDILFKSPATNISSASEVDSYAVYQTYRFNLFDLGLLKQNFKKPKKNEFPEFDLKTGMIKSSGYRITILGKLLLKSIDQ